MGQLSDEVQRDCFEWQGLQFRGNGYQWGPCRTGVYFISLTFGATLDLVEDIPSKSRPPVPLLNERCGSFDAGMSVYWRVVVALDNYPFVVQSSGYYPSYLFIPWSAYEQYIVS